MDFADLSMQPKNVETFLSNKGRGLDIGAEFNCIFHTAEAKKV